jgi:DNA-binding transcriptional MerR regulator
MSTIKSFTAKDVCTALGGISRSRLHTWAQLPPFCERPTRERSARRFTKADLLTFAVLQTLEDMLGMRRRDIRSISAAIHHYVRAPRQTRMEEWIFIPQDEDDEEIVLLIQGQNFASPGWVIDMARERERIDLYLGLTPSQRELPLITDVKSGHQ